MIIGAASPSAITPTGCPSPTRTTQLSGFSTVIRRLRGVGRYRQANSPLRRLHRCHGAATRRRPSTRLPRAGGAELGHGTRLRTARVGSRLRAAIGLRIRNGIVCVPSVRGEPPAGKPLQARLAAAHGETLDDWLCRRFFEQHCRLFHNRPFIWHIWDGRKRDGFHALVN